MAPRPGSPRRRLRLGSGAAVSVGGAGDAGGRRGSRGRHGKCSSKPSVMVGSHTQWAPTPVNSGRWWRTEERGVLQSVGWQSVRHDLVTKQQSQPRSILQGIRFTPKPERFTAVGQIFLFFLGRSAPRRGQGMFRRPGPARSR